MPRPQFDQEQEEQRKNRKEKRVANLKKLAATYKEYGAVFDEKNCWVTVPFGKKRRVVETERDLRKVLKL